MEHFARLFARLDQTNKTTEKLSHRGLLSRSSNLLQRHGIVLSQWQKLQRVVSSSLLRQWAIEVAEIEPWLFDECYEAVGDLGETISLVVPRAPDNSGEVSSSRRWPTGLRKH